MDDCNWEGNPIPLNTRDIQVYINEPAPIVVLFGPSGIGKTMTLVRLSHFLIKKGYLVSPDRNFVDSKHYPEACNTYEVIIKDNGDTAPYISGGMMMVTIRNNSRVPICQIYDASGDQYFDSSYPDTEFPRHFNRLISSANPKIWLFFIEKNWESALDRHNYAEKIRRMQAYMGPKDEVIFICSKADKHPYLFNKEGQPFTLQFYKEIRNQFPYIFSAYENKIPIKWFRKYNFDFIVFSSGNFYMTEQGECKYFESCDKYPATLWESIMKSVKGRWW